MEQGDNNKAITRFMLEARSGRFKEKEDAKEATSSNDDFGGEIKDTETSETDVKAECRKQETQQKGTTPMPEQKDKEPKDTQKKQTLLKGIGNFLNLIVLVLILLSQSLLFYYIFKERAPSGLSEKSRLKASFFKELLKYYDTHEKAGSIRFEFKNEKSCSGDESKDSDKGMVLDKKGRVIKEKDLPQVEIEEHGPWENYQ